MGENKSIAAYTAGWICGCQEFLTCLLRTSNASVVADKRKINVRSERPTTGLLRSEAFVSLVRCLASPEWGDMQSWRGKGKGT